MMLPLALPWMPFHFTVQINANHRATLIRSPRIHLATPHVTTQSGRSR